MQNGSHSRPELSRSRFDVAVIGGGINGVAIARECALAGRSTLIVERHDFAAGTTSRSTRIIHGGLRYLEHGEVGLVRESLRERERLLAERPHLVRPIQFLLALGPEAHRSALEVRFGLWLYRRFAGAGMRARHSRHDMANFERLLDSGRRWSVFHYEDAQCEFPERLVAEWLVEAADAGAVVRNSTEVLEIDVRDSCAGGLRLRDQLSGREERVEAKWIINAAGPWVDAVCQLAGIDSPRLIGGVRGSHIVLPKFPGAPEAALYTEATDGRPVFLIPWNGQLLVGTTEVPDSTDPADCEASEEEIRYLLQSVQRLFPGAGLRHEHIRYAYAGIRPLPFVHDLAPAAVTRRHFLHDHAPEGAAGFISVVGGKLTTAASLARQCARKIGIPVAEPTAIGCAGDVDMGLKHWAAHAASEANISEQSARAIGGWHGRLSGQILHMAKTSQYMRQRVCAHTPHIVAEVAYAFSHEFAMTLGDALLRRVPLALGECWSESCAEIASRRVGEALGWTEKRIATECEALIAERAAFLKTPALPARVS